MDIGTVLPQHEIGSDPDTLADFATRTEAAGFEHLLAYDHVLGVNPGWDDWDGPYDNDDQFHEPLTTFAYLAAHTDDLSYVTGILILPQRQTALVAKQAAQVDLFSGGNLRLGVANGWNPYEYRSLGTDFETRAARIEEQIEVLRRLWTEHVVEFEGEFHRLPEVGLNPRPVQQPIPIWFGGMADAVKRRTARLGDGWIPMMEPDADAEEHVAEIAEYARAEGRDPDEIGLHGLALVEPGEPDAWIEQAQAWRDLGADYVAVNTMYQDLEPGEHAALIEEVAAALSETGFL